jgi:hypothetical protein
VKYFFHNWKRASFENHNYCCCNNTIVTILSADGQQRSNDEKLGRSFDGLVRKDVIDYQAAFLGSTSINSIDYAEIMAEIESIEEVTNLPNDLDFYSKILYTCTPCLTRRNFNLQIST